MRFNEKTVGGVIVLVALVRLGIFAFDAYQPSSHAEKQPPTLQTQGQVEAARTACEVLTVYDGDTLGCDLNQNSQIERPQEEIRLLGVDSPEMHYSRKNLTHDSMHPIDEPFAPEASRWLTEQTLHKTVYLAFDRRKTDRYGRTLAFIYASPHSEHSFNEELLRLGYAKLLFLGKNRLNEAVFQAVEADARVNRRGLWH